MAGDCLDLPEVDLVNFRVQYVRPRSGRCLGGEAAERATKSREVLRVLNKQDEGLFRKSSDCCVFKFIR